jgi:hypothetical protein
MYLSVENVVLGQSNVQFVIADELTIDLFGGDALAAGCVDRHQTILGNVEIGRREHAISRQGHAKRGQNYERFQSFHLGGYSSQDLDRHLYTKRDRPKLLLLLWSAQGNKDMRGEGTYVCSKL